MAEYPDHTRVAQKLLDQQGEVNRLTAELAEMRGNYEGACKTIADMHAAATGRTGLGPIRGVVEDVEDVRLRAEQADAVTAETKGLIERRTKTLRARAERAEAANARVRQALDDESYGGPERDDVITAICTALDEPGPAATESTIRAGRADEQPVQACNGCGTPAHPYLNCDQARQASEADRE